MTWSAIPASLRAAVCARDGDRCQYCHASQVGQLARFHIDHVVPKSRGGPTSIDNLVVQCPHCSVAKSAKLRCTDPLTGQNHPIFHPLRSRWVDHFSLRPDGTILGRTSLGRAMIVALRMNDGLPRDARA